MVTGFESGRSNTSTPPARVLEDYPGRRFTPIPGLSNKINDTLGPFVRVRNQGPLDRRTARVKGDAVEDQQWRSAMNAEQSRDPRRRARGSQHLPGAPHLDGMVALNEFIGRVAGERIGRHRIGKPRGKDARGETDRVTRDSIATLEAENRRADTQIEPRTLFGCGRAGLIGQDGDIQRETVCSRDVPRRVQADKRIRDLR